jgi:hypothetical protein
MSVENLLTQLGIRYRVIENEAVAKCPFHYPDRNPSWSCNLKSGLHHCFSCGAKGNLAYLVSSVAHVPYTEAVIKVNETIGFARMDKWREDYETVSFSPMSLKVTEADMALFTDPPQESLDSKNITIEAANYYGIRWNPEHSTWICPYRDPYSSELWGWQEKNAHVFRNYPAGVKRGKTLFGIDRLRRSGGILVESPIDCAVLYCAGYENSVSSLGMPSLYQLSLIRNKRVSSLLLALDNDKAGISGTRDLIYEAVKMFKTVRVYNYGNSTAKDPGEQNEEDIIFGISCAVPALQWLRGERLVWAGKN